MIFFNQSNIPQPILKTHHVRFLLIIIYCAETSWLQKNIEKPSVATENTGHEVNAEKNEQMFINCVENVGERHNIKVSNTSYCEGITQENRN